MAVIRVSFPALSLPGQCNVLPDFWLVGSIRVHHYYKLPFSVLFASDMGPFLFIVSFQISRAAFNRSPVLASFLWKHTKL